jgi:hypothetical protein
VSDSQPTSKKVSSWYRVEVSDHDGQIVAIEPEMLCGRDIGDAERATIQAAIDTLAGFIGQPNFREMYAMEAHAKMVLMQHYSSNEPPVLQRYEFHLAFQGSDQLPYIKRVQTDTGQWVRFEDIGSTPPPPVDHDALLRRCYNALPNPEKILDAEFPDKGKELHQLLQDLAKAIDWSRPTKGGE